MGEEIATLEHALDSAERREVVDAANGIAYEVEEYITENIGKTGLRLMIDILPENPIRGIYHVEYDGEFLFTQPESQEIVFKYKEDTPEIRLEKEKKECRLAGDLINGLVMKEMPLTPMEKFLRFLSGGHYPPKKEISRDVNYFSIREAVREAHKECAKHYNIV